MNHNKYAVHLYTQVRVKITGVEASTVAEAMEKAESAVQFHDLLDNPHPAGGCGNGMQVECIEWAEAPLDYALVDPLTNEKEVDYDKAVWLDRDGKPLVDGKTGEERKATGYDKACLFMKELLDSVETLTGIADEHGARTLADLFYLHSAIMEGGFVDCCQHESKVLEIAGALPSCAQWLEFIKIE